MKLIVSLIFAFVVASFSNSLLLSEIVTYVASDNPSANPDGNTNTVDVWTTSFTSGDSGQNGSFFAGGTDWALYSNSSQTADMRADVSALLPTSNRDLGIAGDSFSLDFTNGSVNSGGSVGVELLDENGNRRMEFGFQGGAMNYYLTDTGGTMFDSGVGFTSSGLNLALSLDNVSGGYTLNFGGQTFNRTFLNSGSSIAEIRVFSFNAGGSNDLLANNLSLSAVPEPTALVTFGIALTGLCVRRRR